MNQYTQKTHRPTRNSLLGRRNRKLPQFLAEHAPLCHPHTTQLFSNTAPRKKPAGRSSSTEGPKRKMFEICPDADFRLAILGNVMIVIMMKRKNQITVLVRQTSETLQWEEIFTSYLCRVQAESKLLAKPKPQTFYNPRRVQSLSHIPILRRLTSYW
jgi:hypothetical protein